MNHLSHQLVIESLIPNWHWHKSYFVVRDEGILSSPWKFIYILFFLSILLCTYFLIRKMNQNNLTCLLQILRSKPSKRADSSYSKLKMSMSPICTQSHFVKLFLFFVGSNFGKKFEMFFWSVGKIGLRYKLKI